MRKLLIVILVPVILYLFASLACIIVGETEQTVIIQWGNPVRTITSPGLHFKIPFIQEVLFFEKRILDHDSDPDEVYTKDEKNLMVDNYARWRIEDPLLFYQSVGTMAGAYAQLDDIIYSAIRAELGRYTLEEIVSPQREEIMRVVTQTAYDQSRRIGIEIIDVRIKRADLPQANVEAIYSRMEAAREQDANRYRAEGERTSQEIKSAADKERIILLANANKEAEKLRGEGEAEALKIIASTLNQDPEFYRFLKTLEAYEKTLPGTTKLIISPDSDFLYYLNNIEPAN